ncbi:YqeB family protein [Embleya sp. AB8]|uniref:YqeB family protein n=1 Tax=Embleya sp. AB8 TaxID=3156304 RepID=UPI003C716819
MGPSTAGDEQAVTIRMPRVWLWLIGVGTALVGFGAGFGISPLVRQLTDLSGSAPAPLRLAARLPTLWAVPVLTGLGAAVGAWMASVARRESPVVTVTPGHFTIRRDGAGLQVRRDRVDAVFTDGKDLVALDTAEIELVRIRATDLPTERLRDAFTRFDYPWSGTTDPHEAEFTPWVDGTPDLDDAEHALLRARKHALADKQPGAAEQAREHLRAGGIVVRDRRKTQQYRRCRPHPPAAEDDRPDRS